MKSLKAAGDEVLELSELLLSTGQERESQTPGDHNFSQIMREYNAATGNPSLQVDSRLKNVTEHFNTETLRLSVTSPKHPHFQQIRSSQRFAKELFSKEIQRLIELN